MEFQGMALLPYMALCQDRTITVPSPYHHQGMALLPYMALCQDTTHNSVCLSSHKQTPLGRASAALFCDIAAFALL